MRLDKVSDRVYANTEGKTGGNVGIVVLPRRVVAVDSMFPVPGEDFRKSIPGITKRHVSHLLLTHVHSDHVFGNQAFEDADIVAHFRLKEKMEDSLKTAWTPKGLEKMLEDMKKSNPDRVPMLKGLRIVLPTTTFERSYRVGDVRIVNTGGHTDCSSYVYVPKDRVLFAGDNLFVGRFPWAGDSTADPDRWIKALQAYLKLDVDVIVPGHGSLCDKAEVEKQLKWFRAMRRMMKRLVSEGVPEDEAVKARYPEIYPSDRPEWVQNSLRVWFRHWKA
ncbi:MAG: MBL fold metallo-hydrolase [Candidatus Bathyarchaeota archaeon]|nr:MBL fold metallo-hydrolase [Candidatus Bathyarchaeota archaeon]